MHLQSPLPYLWLALIAAGPAWAADSTSPIVLQALVATSGDGPERLLDGNPETGWTPAGDPADEGVLFRFEQPLQAQRVRVRACPGTTAPVHLYVNGATDLGTRNVTAAGKEWGGASLRSIFLRLERSQKACLAEVSFLDKGGRPLDVRPPRSVKGRVQASSVLTPADAYHPSFLFDGRIDFGWVEGAPGTGAGESVTLTLDQPVEITKLELWNGYQRSPDHFRKNARAGRLAISADGGPPISVKVKDAMGAQILELPRALQGTRFTFTIEKAIPGTKYPDLVLSELRLWDASGRFTVSLPDREERRKALEAELAGSGLAPVVNRAYVSRCSDTVAQRGQGSFKLRTDHTFVWYQETSQTASADDGPPGGSEASEVFDGAWVLQRKASPWAEVEFYGRRQRTTRDFRPYAEDEVTRESPKVSGGRVQIARLEDLGAKAAGELFDRELSEAVSCLPTRAGGAAGLGPSDYRDLVAHGAIVVRGPAITDVLWRP